MSKAKSNFFNGPANPATLPLFTWRDEVEWFHDDAADGKAQPGEQRILSNGYVSTYKVDADGDGFIFTESQHTYSNGTSDLLVQDVTTVKRIVAAEAA